MNINSNQINSLKIKIQENDALIELAFSSSYDVFFEQNIKFILLERYNYKIKLVYVIVPLKLNEQFNNINELQNIAKKYFNNRNANIGYYGTCFFVSDNATSLHLDELKNY